MKKIFIILLVCSSLATKAQRVKQITKDDLYELVRSDISFLMWTGYDIVHDSKNNLEIIRNESKGKYVREPISKKLFHEKNIEVIEIPVMDSTGETIGSKKEEVGPNVLGLFSSKELSNEMKVGLIFSHDIGHYKSEYNLNNENYYVVFKTSEMDVVKQKRRLLFLDLISNLDFNLDSCLKIKYNINGIENKLSILPTNFDFTDSIRFIHEIVDKLFKEFNNNFNATYYTKGISNFRMDNDKYGNIITKTLLPERDTLDILDVTTNNYKKVSVNTLTTRKINSISIAFLNNPETNSFKFYVGAGKNIVTSSGIDLGYSDYFLNSADADKMFSKTSSILIKYLTSIYQ